MKQSVEVARQIGQENRRVSLTASEQGVRMEAFDAGPTAERFFGRDEYQFWGDVKAMPFRSWPSPCSRSCSPANSGPWTSSAIFASGTAFPMNSKAGPERQGDTSR